MKTQIAAILMTLTLSFSPAFGTEDKQTTETPAPETAQVQLIGDDDAEEREEASEERDELRLEKRPEAPLTVPVPDLRVDDLQIREF